MLLRSRTRLLELALRAGAAAPALLIGVLPAQAQDARALQLATLAGTCAACHGTQGKSVPDAAVPGLAGMPATYMVEQLKAFKSGARSATIMHQLSKGYTDAQIDQLAAYFAAQKR